VRSERGEGAQNEKRMKPKLEQGPGTNKRVAARERERERGGRREEGEGRREERQPGRQGGREGGRRGKREALRCVALQCNLQGPVVGVRQQERGRKSARWGDGGAAPTGDVKIFIFIFFPSSEEGRKRN